MEETKERLKYLIDFFTGQYLQSLNYNVAPTTLSLQNNNNKSSSFEPDNIDSFIDDVNNENESQTPQITTTSADKLDPTSTPASVHVVTKLDLELILKTLELCKANLTHFSINERSYLMPLMTLCGHVLLTETHLISRSHLSTVSDVLIYILQFLMGEITNYSEDDSNYLSFNPTFLKQMNDVQKQLSNSYDSAEYYQYFIKYRLIKFLSFMLLDDDKSIIEYSLQPKDLYALCQMLRMKPVPDTLRLRNANFNQETSSTSAVTAAAKTISSSTSNPITITSPQSSVKRLRLTQPGQNERITKEQFFDQLLTPFIHSSSLTSSSNSAVAATATNITIPATNINNLSLSNSFDNNVNLDPNAPLRNSSTSSTAVTDSASKILFKKVDDTFLQKLSKNTPISSSIAFGKITTTQSTQQIRSHLIIQNQMCFQYIGGATSILNLINNFTLLRPYILHLLAIEEGVPLRLSRMDDKTFHLICDLIDADIDLVMRFFALNRLLEPLTCDRISKMIVIVQSSLIACLSLISNANQLSTISTSFASNEMTPVERSILKIIEKSLSLYNIVFDIFRQSNRVAGQINQNAHMFTTWLLFSGLQMILNNFEQGSSSSTSNSVKRQQGYSLLCIPLAKHALQLMSFLLDDLYLEFGDRNLVLDDDVEETEDNSSVKENVKKIKAFTFFKKFSFNLPSQHKSSTHTSKTTLKTTNIDNQPRAAMASSSLGSSTSQTIARSNNATFKYNKFGHYSAWQRIDMIVSSNLNVLQLLFSYLSAGYRRATLLRHSSCKLLMDSNDIAVTPTTVAAGHTPARAAPGHTPGAKPRTICDEDDEDEDEEDEDEQQRNRRLLTDFVSMKKKELSEFDLSDSELWEESLKNDGENKMKKELKEKLEQDIDNHYELVISILDHLNFRYICSKIDALRSYFQQMLNDAQLIVLAHIIQDLDSELDNVQVSTPLSTKTFNSFSSSLSSFMHNLIAMQLLSDEQQNSLLAYLGFKPSLDSECSWPLHHGKRSLAILAQIILLRQQKEQEDIKLDLNSTTIQIWRGFINKLKQSALSFNGELAPFNLECPDYQEDLNVEHAQLMLFLFHYLKLLQRKHVFSLVFTAIHEISQKLYNKKQMLSAAQILFIGRILHLFEYMCKNLYDTPSYLFEQVNKNLMITNPETPPSLDSNKEDSMKLDSDEVDKHQLDLLRSIKYFPDRKLDQNYYNYLCANHKMIPKKLENIDFAKMENDFNVNFIDFIRHPRFYHLMDVTTSLPKSSTLRNFKPKLDGIACNFMLAGFSSLSYDQFYNSLLNLMQVIGYQYDFDTKTPSSSQQQFFDHENAKDLICYPQFGGFGLCSIDYTFGTLWRLLNQLPPSLQFLQDIIVNVEKSIRNEKSFVSIDVSRILNMCIWLPRFENNRPVVTWVSELLSKTGNTSSEMNESFSNNNSANNNVLKITPADIENKIQDLVHRFTSLEFNYYLLKCTCWSFFRYIPPINTFNLPPSIKNRLLVAQHQLIPLQYYKFPKFFTIFTMDIFMERLVTLLNAQYKYPKLKKTINSEIILPDQDLIEKLLNTLMGLFSKIYNDLNALLIYDAPLTNAGKNDPEDMKYLFYRSMVNICTTNSYEINISDMLANFLDYLPQSIVSKMDQWDRIYANVDRNISDTETPALFQKGILFDIPLIELPANSGSKTTSSSSTTVTTSKQQQQSLNLYHFSAFINERYAIIDTPNVVAVNAGYANLTWIKLKQFMVKLFKFCELVYFKKSSPLPDDQFIASWLFELNFISKTLATKMNEMHESSTYQLLDQMFHLQNDLDYNETYCTILYPYFIANGYFILTVYNHPLFNKLNENDRKRFQKIFQFCSIEFCEFFSKIVKRESGMLTLEEFICEDSPKTPTRNENIMQQQQQPIYEPNYSLLNLIEVTCNPLATTEYSVKIMKFFKSLLSKSCKIPDNISMIRLCSELSSALNEHPDRTKLLTTWFEMVLFNRTSPTEELVFFDSNNVTISNETQFFIDDNSNSNLYLFFKFIIYATKEESRFDEVIFASMADALIANMQKLLDVVYLQTENQFLYFSGLFTSLIYLISASKQSRNKNLQQPSPSNGKPIGHFKLIYEVIRWLSYIKNYLLKQEKLCGKNIESTLVQGKKRFLLEAAFQMLSYLSDIFNAMEYKFVYLKSHNKDSSIEDVSCSKKEDKDLKKSEVNNQKTKNNTANSRIFIDDDFDLDNKHLNKESCDDKNDEDDNYEVDLANQLCTFTQTQKEFINQHWYHCHTCKMVDGKGVCTVCAKVCHRGHDITYSKHGSFFCDCGASEDNSCKALVKRETTADNNKSKERKHKKSDHVSLKHRFVRMYESQLALNKLNKRRSMRISKYWYQSFYSMDSYYSKLADNYKHSKNKFSNQLIMQNYDRFGLKNEHFENFGHLLQSYIGPLTEHILSLMEFFMPMLERFFRTNSELGYLTRIRKEFQLLQSKQSPLYFEKSEHLMVAIKSWQDPVFENVQMTQESAPSARHYQVVYNCLIRRKLMLVLGANTSNSNQASLNPCLLIVAHDMNRLSIIQLNQLLGQAYVGNSKKKITPQKIATVSFPFTIMTIAHNPLNNELISICGLQECHILSLAKNGSITGHRSLSTKLENSTHISKTYWFPDSETQIALVTSEFIKIYDISKEDDDQPLYNFSIPSRKIRDMTYFSCEENGKKKRFLLIFSGRGPIYAQELNQESQCSSSNDVFYVTNLLNLIAPNSDNVSIAFSIYYSHLLQMLFFSYLDGNTFCAPFNLQNIYKQEISDLTPLDQFAPMSSPNTTPAAANNNLELLDSLASQAPTVATVAAALSTSETVIVDPSNKSTKPNQSQLFRWTEIPTHPGLIFAIELKSYNVVCFMISSTSVKSQVLKPKKKILDIAAVSTIPAIIPKSQQIIIENGCYYSKVTTLITLCEDGSLRFHRASNEHTNFWLKPNLYNLDEMPSYSNIKNYKSISNKLNGNIFEQTTGGSNTSSLVTNKTPHFPVDFFENCTLLNDIEFGGSDVLEVYNVQQIKSRLNSANMFIACTKPNGFSISITQTGSFDEVMAGVRVNLGVCEPSRSPTSIEIFGRTINIPTIHRHRWFDIPFTRSEMKKLIETPTFSIRFVSSPDPNQVTIVDSIRVYSKSRDTIRFFDREDDDDDEGVVGAGSSSNSNANNANTSSSIGGIGDGIEISLEDLRKKLKSQKLRIVSKTKKSEQQRLNLLLFAPSVTDDEYVQSLDNHCKTIFVCNRLMANSLDALEAIISFMKSYAESNVDQQQSQQQQQKRSILLVLSMREMINSNEFKLKCEAALLIASKLLTVSLSQRLDRSISVLIAKLVPNKVLYDEHRVEIIFENAIENLKQEAYDDVNVFGHSVSLFRETVTEHPKFFIRFIGKYFSQSQDYYTSTIHFCNYLVDLFWRLYSQKPTNELISPLTKAGQYSNFDSIVDSLVYILFQSTHAILLNPSHTGSDNNVSIQQQQQKENQQKIINRTSQLVVQMLCSPDLQISFSVKKAFLKILSSNTNSSTNVYRNHMDKISKSAMATPSSKNSGSKSSSNRKPTSKSSTDSTGSSQVSSSRPPIAGSNVGSRLAPTSSDPSTSFNFSTTSQNAAAFSLLRRQGATRRTRSSGATSSQAWLTRQDSLHQAPSGSNQNQNSQSGNPFFASDASRGQSLLDRVSNSLMGNEFDPYSSLLLNINSDFPYFQDLIANLRREPDVDEAYDRIPDYDDDDDDDEDEDDDDEDEDDDDDEDDYEEDDDVSDLNPIAPPLGEQNNSGTGVPPPLFALDHQFPIVDQDGGSGSVAEQQPAAVLEVLDEDVRVDEDDEDEDDDDFEAMDEDEMMEIAIALSLQDQRGAVEEEEVNAAPVEHIEGMAGYVVNDDGAVDETDAIRQQRDQVQRSLEELVENYRLQFQHHGQNEEVNQVEQQQLEPNQPSQSSSTVEAPVTASNASGSSTQHYSTLHSESEDDDEELIDDEMHKLADTTMESIEVEEEHDYDYDDDELNSMETSSSSLMATLQNSSKKSKSNETSKRGSSGASGSSTTPQPSATTQPSSNSSGDKASKNQKDAQKTRRRQKRLAASKFCLSLLKQMLNSIETIFKLNGVQAIPFLQVLSMLVDFNYSESDLKEFCMIFNQIIQKLCDNLLMLKQQQISSTSINVEEPGSSGSGSETTSSPFHQIIGSSKSKQKILSNQYKDRIKRQPENEVQLLILRLFSIFLSYFKRFPTLTWQTFLNKDLPISDKFRALASQYGTAIISKSKPSTVTFDEESIKSQAQTSSPSTSSVPSGSAAQTKSVTIHPGLLLAAAQMIELNANILDYCFTMLHHLLRHFWRQFSIVEQQEEYDKNKSSSKQIPIDYFSKSIKIRPHVDFIPMDLRPFFTILPETASTGTNQIDTATVAAAAQDTTGVVVVNNVINTCSNLSNTCTAINSVVFTNNVFDLYAELLTEIALRMPYQLKKMITFLNEQNSSKSGNKKDSDGKDDASGAKENQCKSKTASKSTTPPIDIEFGAHWIETLCEYMTLPCVTPYIRKQARKLLSNLCGSKERYRQVRDYYAIKTNLRSVREIIVLNFLNHSSATTATTSSSQPTSSSISSSLALKLQDIGLTEEDLDDEEQLDEFIRIIIGTVVQNDDKNSKMMMMSSDQHRLLNLPYAQLINLVDFLKACLDIASTRVQNWQRLCRREVRIVPFLFRISFLFGEGISSIILQLLSLALFSSDGHHNKAASTTTSSTSASKKPTINVTLNLTQNLLMTTNSKTKNKTANETSTSSSIKTASKDNHQSFICCNVFMVLDSQLLSHFIRFFLLESNSSQQRWATHSLLYMFFESLQPTQQEQFLSLFWQLWPDIAGYGKRASQFVDLLGYFTLTISKSNQSENQTNRIAENERLYADSAVGLLRYQNQVLIKHPNANIYNSLQTLLDLNGYYLETEPCLVCNNPEINFFPVKLSAIKLDSRFTTNTQIVKLIGAHTISKITVKISELKKSKMVKTLCIYYNNRYVQSVVELKNKNTVWHKAKRITLTPSQSEVKIEFTLPIVACNLMIEYANFYETSHSSTETLQCPRCSAVVLAIPGVCTNCGENVFQCHKCRAINYDEKDPFLCNSCGFCKYAKFDYVLTARYTASAVEAIENEEDRAKAVQTINNLLEKADRLYKIILSIRPTLEYLLLASQDYQSYIYQGDGSIDAVGSGANATPSGSGGAVGSSSGGNQQATSSALNSSSAAGSSSSSALNINRYIHKLASKYSNDCRVHFEELSKIVQKILYTRKELVDYDNRQTDNKNNFEDIKRSLQEYRQDYIKAFGGSSTSLSSTSSSTLIDISTPTSTSGAFRKQLKQSLITDEHYHETKKKKLSPNDNEDINNAKSDDSILTKFNFKSGRCYGCAIATIEHCIILLRALVHNSRYKNILSSSNLFRELIDYNLRIGMPSFRNKVRSLLCLLIRDDYETTEEFNNLLLEKIGSVLTARYMTSFDFGFIRHEMSLLASSFENEDNCWEQRLRCVLKLFLLSLKNKSPALLEAITLPCLRILYGLIIKPTTPTNTVDNKKLESSAGKQSTSTTMEHLASVQTPVVHTIQKPITHIPFETVVVNVSVDLNQWLAGDKKSSFSAWQQRNIKVPATLKNYIAEPEKLTQLEEHLQRKYFSRWLYLYQSGQIRGIKSECFIVRIASSIWVQEVLFNPTSKALRSACKQLLMALFEKLTSKQRVLIDLFTSFLDDLCRVGGEIGLDFYDLYRSIVFSEFSASAKTTTLARNCHWRYYLTFCGLLPHLAQLISTEIDRLKQLEESTLSSDFSQGSALRQLVELMQLFMRDERIRRVHKSSLVAFVLDGYLSLRKLIIQRTKMIDETQAALLELLELLTTGTRAETINFMKVCIESVKKCPLQDLRTPVFIFERLCSIIHPEEKDADEFFISLEKDPQQEDFLQGRMLGNPYSSKDSGMGPLMRDIKNKICQECELVSLLEDDSGLELLVNNKIISLDLPVKAVYKKIVCADAQQQASSGQNIASGNQAIFGSGNNSWASGISNLVQDVAILDTLNNTLVFPFGSVLNQNTNASSGSSSIRSSGPTMKIVYRIRGLMGDATEEFIESLSNKESIVKDDEKLFDLANVMSDSSGLSVMLERLAVINEIDNRSRNLLFVLLKLFGYCVRVSANRRALMKTELNAIGIMLRVVHLFLKNPQSELLTTPSAPGEPSYFEQLLSIIETILAEASKEEPEVYDNLNREAFGTVEDVQLLINAVATPKSLIFKSGIQSLTNRFLRVVTFLSIGHPEKMTTLVKNFRPYFEFDLFDNDTLNYHEHPFQAPYPKHWYELFCELVEVIERNHNGARLKNRMIEEGFVMMAIDYLVRNAPPMKNFVLLNSEEWKEFISKPALTYVLRMLTGMSRGHEPTQMLIVEEGGVPIIHALEQVLSDSHLATLAENLMDALKDNPSVEAKIEEIRLKTREEKKRIAMAVREKQLGELGMKANDKGQVMADTELLKKMEGELKEEKGLVCSICREGYAYQPQKVLAIYTFTKRCNVEEYEDRKPRKFIGYTTVTHFNIVHVECHMDAVRHARTRDEWQSASLHNANTRCNGLLPLWGPNVYESLFAHALSRHNSYLQDAVGQRDFQGTNSFLGTIHDLKLLLLRFAQEKSFSEETGGGGAQSNLYLTPYLMHTALYVMNTTKVTDKERTNLDENFIHQNSQKFIESCFQIDGAFFYSTMVLLLHPQSFWKTFRLFFLRRLILCNIIRSLPANARNLDGITNAVVEYKTIKPALMFFALINLFYTIMFKNVEVKPDGDWSQTLVDFIRHNDQSLLESADKMLETFENDILPSASFAEFCDACDLMRGEDGINNPDEFLQDIQKSTLS